MTLRDGAVEVGLLFGDGVFGLFDLCDARISSRAVVDRRELTFKAAANWI